MPTDYAIKDGRTVFDATTYTGTGSAQTITNAGKFQPDLVWQKARAEVANHRLVDSVRGVDKVLYSSSTAAEATTDGVVDSFNSNGFTGGGGDVTGSGNAAVAWQWKAGGTAVSNTAGSITSSVSANTTAGFSVVTYTGAGGGVAKTFGHGLGVAPNLIIIKDRQAGITGTDNWVVYHSSLGATGFVSLNSTNAFTTSSAYWNNTAPTSSVVTVGGNSSNVSNESGIGYVAYCWAEVAGFSKFGTYTGNYSNDGAFIYTGFRPKFILIKAVNNAYDWELIDTGRSTYNGSSNYLQPNLSNAEYSTTSDNIDILSNGFKMRSQWTRLNDTVPYIYAAFAENPFKYANAR